ncbi:C39 family peptidase [Candidatus Peregrinibacteria bacterium]|nr:C39 family peptidase [Candidatus Peregrinibacteria bacterium]
MKRFYLAIGALVLVSCAPNEADFKSAVPVSKGPIETAVQPLSEAPSISTRPRLAPPTAINLAVPFYPQAPDGNWDAPWQEACEEASSVQAVYYATGKALTKDQFRAEILALVDWENNTFGSYEHTTVEQTARMIREALGFSDFEIVENPTVDQLKGVLAKGSVVVAPFSGKDLKNPFYSNGGPLYHMMVIRGFDSKNFIVNDVGTKRGENFIYPYARIMETMHDWNDANIHLGAKRVIVLNPISK